MTSIFDDLAISWLLKEGTSFRLEWGTAQTVQMLPGNCKRTEQFKTIEIGWNW